MSDELYDAVAGAGKGGDGLLTILKTLAYAGMAKGLKVAYSSNYNPETRGGLVEGCTILSKEDALSPVVDSYTTVLAFDNQALDTYMPLLEPGGLLIWNSSVVRDRSPRPDVRSVAIPASDLAVARGVPKFGNMIVLGAFARLTGYFSVDELIRGMELYLPVWRHKLIPINRQVLGGVLACDMSELTGPPARASFSS